jgi:hypothetical protein
MSIAYWSLGVHWTNPFHDLNLFRLNRILPREASITKIGRIITQQLGQAIKWQKSKWIWPNILPNLHHTHHIGNQLLRARCIPSIIARPDNWWACNPHVNFLTPLLLYQPKNLWGIKLFPSQLRHPQPQPSSPPAVLLAQVTT